MWRHDPEGNLSVDPTTGEILQFRGTSSSGQMLFEYHTGDLRLPVAVMADDVTAVGLRRWTLDYDWVVRDWGGGFHEDVPAHVEPASWWPDRALWEAADDALESALLNWPETAETGPPPIFLKRLGGYLGYGWSPWLARFTLPPQPEVLSVDTPLQYLLGENVPPWAEPDWAYPYIRHIERSEMTSDIYGEEYRAGRRRPLPPEIEDYVTRPGQHWSRWRRPNELGLPKPWRNLICASEHGEQFRSYNIFPMGHRDSPIYEKPITYIDEDKNEYSYITIYISTIFEAHSCIGIFHSRDHSPASRHPQWPKLLAQLDGHVYPLGGAPPPEWFWRKVDRASIEDAVQRSFSTPRYDFPKEVKNYKNWHYEGRKMLSVRIWGGYFNNVWIDDVNPFKDWCFSSQFFSKKMIEKLPRDKLKIPLFREIVPDLRRLKH